jgi:hypothetical protein
VEGMNVTGLKGTGYRGEEEGLRGSSFPLFFCLITSPGTV